MNKIIAILFVVIGCLLALNLFYTSRENYKNYENLGGSAYPVSLNNVLVEDVYPIHSKSGVSEKSGHDIWWHYPIFEVGSYKQITNNLKYPNNPDDGRCMPAEFCGALYKNHQDHSNVSTVLPPVDMNSGLRINYYTTPETMFAFSQDSPNILY